MDQTDSNTGATDRESVHARVLNASREQVLHAFRAPDGDDYENEYVVEEIAERQRIVFSHSDSAHSVHLGAAACELRPAPVVVLPVEGF
jgi:hypothetical protein